jgi:sulfur-oxidizing protein SoxZ
MASIKIRAKSKDGVTTVKTLMSHPMETGLRKDESGKLIPAHHITEVTAEYNGDVIMSANWSGAISTNPYLSFKFKGGASGEKVKITWVDNKGEGDSLEAAIK